jgi:hypothetical protein
MEINVGSTDSIVRLALGAVAGVVSLAILAESLALPLILSPVLGVAALIFLVTGSTNRCPAYSLLGVNTCSRSAQK